MMLKLAIAIQLSRSGKGIPHFPSLIIFVVEDAVGKQELIFGQFEIGDEIAEILVVGTPAMQQNDRA